MDRHCSVPPSRSTSDKEAAARDRSAAAGGPKLGVWGAVIVVAVLVLLALTPIFIAGLKKTPRDRVGISYGGGPIRGRRTTSASSNPVRASSSTGSSTRSTCTPPTR